MTPTQRSLRYLRDLGYTCEVVERWNPHARVRQDLFGFADIIAFRRGEVLLVQTTTNSNRTARVAKVSRNEIARAWLGAMSRTIQVHGWRKLGGRWAVHITDMDSVLIKEQMSNIKNPPPFCRECRKKAMRGYRYCQYHLEKDRKRQKEEREASIACGRCVYPSCTEPRGVTIYCEHHRDCYRRYRLKRKKSCLLAPAGVSMSNDGRTAESAASVQPETR